MKPLRSLLSIALLATLPLTGGGCASLSLAAIGTALGVAGSAASSGSSVYHLGKLDDVFMADYETTRLAAVLAADDLRLRTVQDGLEDPKHPDVWHFRFEDDLHAKVVVTIAQRSARLCRVRVDVGFFGSEPTSRIFMDQLRAHLAIAPRAATTQPIPSAS